MCRVKVSMDSIKATKSVLRKEIENVIGKLLLEEKSRQSQAVFQKLVNLPQYHLSQRISLYLSTDTEINTVPILKHIFDNGKKVYVPKYDGKIMKMVELNSMQDYESLPLTKWNIKQPARDDVRDDALETGGLDLIVLPGVAFTTSGKRLGHGMGYYDKYLQKCMDSQPKKPYLIAVAFNEQIKHDIPTNEHDVILDLILTEN